MLLRSGKAYNSKASSETKEAPPIPPMHKRTIKDEEELKVSKSFIPMDKCYPINYINLSKFYDFRADDISYYENRVKEPSDNKEIQIHTMGLILDLIHICSIKDNTVNLLYNRLYWLNELLKYFLKAEHLKQVKKLVEIMKSKLDTIQYHDIQYRNYNETLQYFTYVSLPLFEKMRSELKKY